MSTQTDEKDARQSRDEHYMARALELAVLGLGKTSPNPMVGCVIVREGRIVGEGHHEAAGMPHAEIVALGAAGPRATRATAYVTLEPCCIYGRTPPCTEALIEAGVARVVAATQDPNPKVSGRGLARLRQADIDVACGVREEEAARLNEVYAKWISTGVPFVTAKWAMSLDGKTAARRGARTRLTGEEANRRVHELRAASDAIVVGVGTVLADDPQLTVRHAESETEAGGPLRVVVDSRGRTPADSVLARTAWETPVLVAVTEQADGSNVAALRAAGVDVVTLPASGGRVDVTALLKELGHRKKTSVLVEGGAHLAGSLAAAGLIDKVVAFVTPCLVGSAEAPGAVETAGAVEAATGSGTRAPVGLINVMVEVLGRDVMIAGYPAADEGEQQCLPV